MPDAHAAASGSKLTLRCCSCRFVVPRWLQPRDTAGVGAACGEGAGRDGRQIRFTSTVPRSGATPAPVQQHVALKSTIHQLTCFCLVSVAALDFFPFLLCQAVSCGCGERAQTTIVPCGHSTLLCERCQSAQTPPTSCPRCGADVQQIQFQNEALAPRQQVLVPLLSAGAAGL